MSILSVVDAIPVKCAMMICDIADTVHALFICISYFTRTVNCMKYSCTYVTSYWYSSCDLDRRILLQVFPSWQFADCVLLASIMLYTARILSWIWAKIFITIACRIDHRVTWQILSLTSLIHTSLDNQSLQWLQTLIEDKRRHSLITKLWKNYHLSSMCQSKRYTYCLVKIPDICVHDAYRMIWLL